MTVSDMKVKVSSNGYVATIGSWPNKKGGFAFIKLVRNDVNMVVSQNPLFVSTVEGMTFTNERANELLYKVSVKDSAEVDNFITRVSGYLTKMFNSLPTIVETVNEVKKGQGRPKKTVETVVETNNAVETIIDNAEIFDSDEVDNLLDELSLESDCPF